MRPDSLPVLAALRQAVHFNADRQDVIAENVANANTPGYMARDLDQNAFARALQDDMQSRRTSAGGLSMRVSTPGHLAAQPQAGGSREWSTVDAPDSETTINGNSVVLEEQMVKANEARMNYETALALYDKNVNMIRTAIRSPGR